MPQFWTRKIVRNLRSSALTSRVLFMNPLLDGNEIFSCFTVKHILGGESCFLFLVAVLDVLLGTVFCSTFDFYSLHHTLSNYFKAHLFIETDRCAYVRCLKRCHIECHNTHMLTYIQNDGAIKRGCIIIRVHSETELHLQQSGSNRGIWVDFVTIWHQLWQNWGRFWHSPRTRPLQASICTCAGWWRSDTSGQEESTCHGT